MSHLNKYLNNKLVLASCLAGLSLNASAVELLNIKNGDEQTKVTLGGYAKLDVRHVSGDIAYQDYWVANFPAGQAVDTSHTGMSVKESRINVKVQHGELSGFVELDFFGGGGNEVVSNSSNPRLRHFFIDYKNWKLGQTWSTFMPLHALPEALDFGGPHVGEVFSRQVQVRYTTGNWQFAIENPETNGDGDVGAPSSAVGVTGTQADSDESTPDLIARYNHKADWGMVSVGTLLRTIDQGGIDETGIAFNVAAKIKTVGKDDIRFQYTGGDAGRYVSAGLTPDIVTHPRTDNIVVESTDAFTIAYRHYWSNSLRSTAYYGAAETDVLERKRSHWAVNLIDSVNNYLDVGAEFGNYAIDDKGLESIDSNYLQFSAKFKF